MSEMFGTLLQTVFLDDSAYREWGERPNLFQRGIVLIAIITLVAGLLAFAVDLVNLVKPPDVVKLEEQIRQGFEWAYRFNPAMQDLPPEVQGMMDQMVNLIVPMVTDISQIESPLPRGISGFFQATGNYLTRVLAALGGWLFYGALVLIVANMLGGSAKLPDFLGMVSLYVIPTVLAVLRPVPCLGWMLALVGIIWGIVVGIKAVSVATDLDAGRSIVAAIAPFVVLSILGISTAVLAAAWLAIVLP